MTASRRGAVGALLALGTVWGTNFVLMHLAAPFLTAGQTTFLRVAFGLVPILFFALVTRALAWGHLRHAHHFVVQAVLACGFYYFAYAAGTHRLDTSVAGALSGSIPLFAAAAAIAVFRSEPLAARKGLGVILGAVGVAALARPWAAEQVDVVGVAWMLAGSASLGVSFGYARRFICPLQIRPAATVTYQMLIAAIGLAACTDLTGMTALTQELPGPLRCRSRLGFVGTGMAFIFYYVAVNGLGAVTASTATYIAPIVAMTIGVGLLGAPIHPTTIGAVMLILAAAALSELLPRRPASARPCPHSDRAEDRISVQ